MAGRAHAELVHVRDADDHRAGVAQPAVDGRLARLRRRTGSAPQPSRGARHGSVNMSLTATGTPCSGPSGASASICADSLAKRSTIELSGAVALLDARQRRLQQLGRVQLAGGDRARLLAQREVLRVVAHPRGPAASVGEREGSRPCSGAMSLRSAASRASRCGPVDPLGDAHDRQIDLVDLDPVAAPAPARTKRLELIARAPSRATLPRAGMPAAEPAGKGDGRPAAKSRLRTNVRPAELAGGWRVRGLDERTIKRHSPLAARGRGCAARGRGRAGGRRRRRRRRAAQSVVLGKTPGLPVLGLPGRRQAARWSPA